LRKYSVAQCGTIAEILLKSKQVVFFPDSRVFHVVANTAQTGRLEYDTLFECGFRRTTKKPESYAEGMRICRACSIIVSQQATIINLERKTASGA
jgi:tRNA(Phe) wybutosine-synthesizing methylase Tyw3